MEPSERERILEILRQARRPAGEPASDGLEENLRCLVQTTLPEVKASAALRERVQAMAAARRAPRRSFLQRLLATAREQERPGGERESSAPGMTPPELRRLLPSGRRTRAPRLAPAASPVSRRALIGAASLAAASLALFLLLPVRAPAQALARTLAAMARVRSAHCTGTAVSYRDPGQEEGHDLEQWRVEWWYQEPDRYRKDMAPAGQLKEYVPDRLIVKGQRGLLISQHYLSAGRKVELPRAQVSRWLSPLDFFSREGIIYRAQFEQEARITEREGTYHDRKVNVVEVEVKKIQAQGVLAARWVLTVDPSSDLILRSEWRAGQRKESGAWETTEEEILDNFEYNIPVKVELFHPDTSSG